jgi:hypothetical protein
MHVDAVATRIATDTGLVDVRGAAELSALVKSGNLPQRMPAAFVLPLGLRGSQGDAATGITRQALNETIAVVLVAPAIGDETGGRALPTLAALIDAVVARVVGFSPADAIGVFTLGRGQLLSVNDGVVMYQLDFTIADQLRIAG